MLFSKSASKSHAPAHDYADDFSYVDPKACYLDAACQTLRPRPVIEAENEYYLQYNACGGRVKYRWGMTVDERVKEARRSLLSYCNKSEKEYAVAFTLNTTYGINLVLHQLPKKTFSTIVTSEIEHNSVSLPSMTWAANRDATRIVLARNEEGDVLYDASDLQGAVVLLNTMSNIDGRILGNARTLITDTHAAGGIVLFDAAQGFGHAVSLLREADFDAAFGSGHKMYGPSIGFIIIKRSLLQKLDPFFIGGGTVSDAERSAFSLIGAGEEAHAILEAGLQNWAGIIGLNAAVEWLARQHERETRERSLAQTLFDGLRAMPRVQLFTQHPSSIVSFHVEGIDAHSLALYLSERDIMCRSGSFCCHAYLQHQLGLPPLLRVSLGLYNTQAHIDHFLSSLTTILTTL